MDGLSQGAAMVRLRAMLAWMGGGVASPSSRGMAFWLVTVLLALLLPTPIAVAVVVARLRRGRGVSGPERSAHRTDRFHPVEPLASRQAPGERGRSHPSMGSGKPRTAGFDASGQRARALASAWPGACRGDGHAHCNP